jgi:Protein of unknown function (DUF2778).
METGSADKRIWTWVSEDGKHAAAGMSLGSVGTKPGGGGEEQPYDDHGRYLGTAGQGGVSGGSEVRGKVTPPKGKYPPPPPAPKEPHLGYKQKTGDLTGLNGAHMGKGYAGQKEGKNNPDAEDVEGVGPIPQGNWRIQKEVDKATREKNGWPEPAFKLKPDPETEKRVRAMGRNPDSFYVHAKSAQPERQGNGDSEGCIALDKPQRIALRQHIGRWLRVEK